MTESWLLTISSGMGPVEVRQFVRMLAEWLVRELPARGAMLESMVVHGPEDQPSSIDLAVRARCEALNDLLGTHVLVQPSSSRGKRSRKRWYAGVSLAEIELAKSADVNPNDVVFESCRASGAGGQHVNKTESAVRALHTPTGLRVRIESERSQHQNKQRAFEAIAKALTRERSRQDAQAQSERRHRALHVERGRPIASWHLNEGSLVRSVHP